MWNNLHHREETPMTEESVQLTPDERRVLELLRSNEQLRAIAELYRVSAVAARLAAEELRSYERDWNHPLGFALKS